MTTRILPIIAAASLVALFAACSTTPEGDKPGAKPEAAPAPSPTATPRQAPTVYLTKRGAGGDAALKDPNSPL